MSTPLDTKQAEQLAQALKDLEAINFYESFVVKYPLEIIEKALLKLSL